MGDYRGYGKAATPLLPSIGVPTTAGTGSEAQSYAVIADAGTHMKMACGDPSAAFRIAILDPELTLTAPRHVSATAGIDAIAHAVETAVTTRRTPLSDTFSHQAWRLLADGVRARAAPSVRHGSAGDDAARRALRRHRDRAVDARRGARLRQSADRALPASPTASRSRFSFPTSSAGTGWWRCERYAALLGSPRRRARDAEAPETLARRLEDFAVAGGLPARLSDVGVKEEALPELADLAAEQWTGTFNPRPFDAAGALEIYRAAF